jgi:hypothetical protein
VVGNAPHTPADQRLDEIRRRPVTGENAESLVYAAGRDDSRSEASGGAGSLLGTGFSKGSTRRTATGFPIFT